MRASRNAAIALIAMAALLLAGCTAVTGTTPAAVPRSHAPSLVASASRALGSCGLSPTEPGVSAGSGSLRLVTQVAGHPTGVDRADVACVLAALDMPKNDRDLFWSTSISGGSQTVAWRGYSASWNFRDTITFDVELYATA